MGDAGHVDLPRAISELKPKDKSPGSARILQTWIAQAQDRIGAVGPRLGWLVAATVVTAALQRGEIEVIEVPHKRVKPRRFDVTVMLNGVTWRRIPIEVSPDEGNAGATSELITAPTLAAFGLPTPDHLVGLSMRYQIAQKVHASTDPHDPPEFVNDRARDVIDLLLLSNMIDATGQPSPVEIRAAIEDVFVVRAAEAAAAGGESRSWPARLAPHPHWVTSFAGAAESAGVDSSLVEAVEQVNSWLDVVDGA